MTVSGEAPLIDVTISRLGSNIRQAQMEELPLNGRNWQDLAMLAVGNKVNEVGTNEIAAEGTGSHRDPQARWSPSELPVSAASPVIALPQGRQALNESEGVG